jgi:hypothetical protein
MIGMSGVDWQGLPRVPPLSQLPVDRPVAGML